MHRESVSERQVEAGQALLAASRETQASWTTVIEIPRMHLKSRIQA